MPLQLVDVVGVVATVTVILMELGPVPAVAEMLRARATGLTPLVPLVALGTNGWVWTMYGYVGGNIFPVAVSNFVGAVLSVVYTAVFYRFTSERAYARKVIGGFGVFVALATAFAIFGPKALVQSGLGVLGLLTVAVFFASPLENVALVFRHRTAAYIPILLVSVGAVNSAMWSLYGFLAADWFLFVPNFSALLLGLVQIGLYLFFHPNKQLGVTSDKAPAAYGAVNAA